jgi:hypothetical protein
MFRNIRASSRTSCGVGRVLRRSASVIGSALLDGLEAQYTLTN